MPPQFVDTDHLLADTTITLEPDYYDKFRISIENIPIELPDKEVKEFLSTYTKIIGKTYYPGIKHSNKYFTTGTRVYQCIKLTQHIPRNVYHFERYLRIRYDQQPHNKPTNIDNNANQNTNKTPTQTNKNLKTSNTSLLRKNGLLTRKTTTYTLLERLCQL